MCGFELIHILEHIKNNNILHGTIGLPNKSTNRSIIEIQTNLLINNNQFICSTILCDNNSHWCIAVISKNEINIFDPTLQTKQNNNKLKIGDSEQTVVYLNECKSSHKEFIVQHKNGQICGLCCAEFIIQTSQCNSFQHLKDNIEIICDNVTVRVTEAVTKEKIEEQLTDYYCKKIKEEGLTIQELKEEKSNILQPFTQCSITSDNQTSNIQTP